MKDDFMKFMELVNTDETLQKKLEEAGRNYTGEQTEEAVFDCVVVPIAKEAGFSITLDDTKQVAQELNLDEMSQVAGGDGSVGAGLGFAKCNGLGIGLGGGFGDGAAGFCLLLGGGGGQGDKGGRIVCVAAGSVDDGSGGGNPGKI